jgi:hypothetical protein
MAGLVIVTMSALAEAPAPRTMTFIDDGSGLSLTLQIEATAPDAGHSVFRAPARGFYVVETGAAMRVLGPTSVVIDYDGPAELLPATDAQGNVTGTVLAPSHLRQVRLHAQLDPKHHTGEATLTEPSARFHLVTRAVSKAKLGPTLLAFEDALLRNDGRAIYALMNSDVTSRYTPEAFEAYWTAESSTNTVTAVRRISVSDTRTTDNGLSYVVVTYTIEYRSPSGVTGTTTLDDYFVIQDGEWKLLTTRQH